MTINADNTNKQLRLALRISLLIFICFILVASPAISKPLTDINISNSISEDIGSSSLPNCSVEIIKPARGIGYFFDEFEFPLLLIQLPVIIGGITCRAQLNLTDSVEPDFLIWKFANFLGDEYFSFPITYEPGESIYEYYIGRPNIGQFKVWIYCYDINSQLICEDTVSCLKIF